MLACASCSALVAFMGGVRKGRRGWGALAAKGGPAWAGREVHGQPVMASWRAEEKAGAVASSWSARKGLIGANPWARGGFGPRA